ncbi:G-protein coupled receptor family C group 5 member C-like protein [Lates japonicus]|uniref:G-protein coupled receptor family C group 5 member C-like protein n=1 Tax=Lates japonicus TaxID=270547 RepID=A0AAD3R7B4_LATJO|nr:G-protein coupled receptor family C group 5 member C-like protein [Lates japonicus]
MHGLWLALLERRGRGPRSWMLCLGALGLWLVEVIINTEWLIITVVRSPLSGVVVPDLSCSIDKGLCDVTHHNGLLVAVVQWLYLTDPQAQARQLHQMMGILKSLGGTGFRSGLFGEYDAVSRFRGPMPPAGRGRDSGGPGLARRCGNRQALPAPRRTHLTDGADPQ